MRPILSLTRNIDDETWEPLKTYEFASLSTVTH